MMPDWTGEERRQRTLTDKDLEVLAERFLLNHTHKDDHEFVRAWVLKEQRRQEMWLKVKTHVLGWGIVGLVGGLGAAVWEWVRAALAR